MADRRKKKPHLDQVIYDKEVELGMKKERRGGKSLESIAYAIEVGQGTKQERRGAKVTEETTDKIKLFWGQPQIKKLISAMKAADGDHDSFISSTVGKIKSRAFVTKSGTEHTSKPFDEEQILQKARAVKTMVSNKYGVDLPMPKKKTKPAIDYAGILTGLGYEVSDE